MNPLTRAYTIVVTSSPALAQLVTSADGETVAKYGLLGAVLAWFMIRAEKRLGAIEHGLSGVRRTILIDVLSRPGISAQTRRMGMAELKKAAPDLLEELDRDQR